MLPVGLKPSKREGDNASVFICLSIVKRKHKECRGISLLRELSKRERGNAVAFVVSLFQMKNANKLNAAV